MPTGGQGRSHNRQTMNNYYRQALDQRQTPHAIEQDRRYAERLSHSYYDEDVQVTQDHQLALLLSRNRSASPRRDLDFEVAVQLARERSASPPLLDFGPATGVNDGLLAGIEPGLEPTEVPLRARSPGLFVGEGEVLEPEDTLEEEEHGRRRRNCVICGDATRSRNSVRIGCGHRMCRDDLQDLFNRAMTDETLFPPRCCVTHEVSVHAARALLVNDFPPGFEDRATELQTADRTYCHIPGCSTFIPERNITNDVAVCPACDQWTCTLCKQAGHVRGECPQVSRGE